MKRSIILFQKLHNKHCKNIKLLDKTPEANMKKCSAKAITSQIKTKVKS